MILSVLVSNLDIAIFPSTALYACILHACRWILSLSRRLHDFLAFQHSLLAIYSKHAWQAPILMRLDLYGLWLNSYVSKTRNLTVFQLLFLRVCTWRRDSNEHKGKNEFSSFVCPGLGSENLIQRYVWEYLSKMYVKLPLGHFLNNYSKSENRWGILFITSW